jgi:hypothetical protein
MASGKQTPRQKMINMMYLVLTALLALNVSKEILDSFVTVNNGLETTKGTLREKVDGTYATFESYATQNQAKYGAAFNDAKQVKSLASELVLYIDSIKAKSIMATENWPIEKVMGKNANGQDTLINLKHVNAKDNQDGITNQMIGSDAANPKQDHYSAYDLRVKLEAFRDKIKEIATKDPKNANPTLIANVDRMFSFEKEREGGSTGEEVSWEVKNFYHVPLAAGITILSKVQADVRNAENECVNWMLGAVEQKTFKFNTLTAIVKPQSSYVTVGSKYNAEIFLGAYDDKNVPEVYICGPGERVDTTSKPPKIVGGPGTKLPMNGAKAMLEQTASGAGLRQVSGIIKFKPVGGEEQIEAFFTEYEVAAPNLVVSPTKMNVFYRGVDNPVSISVSGYSDKNISPSMTNGSLTKGGEGWIVKPGKESEATISASVTNPDGTKKAMPGMKFRVKNVPNPTPYFAGKSVNDETIKKPELTAAAGVIAKMVDFDFDLKFEVVEYKVTMVVSGTPIEKMTKGAAVSGDMKEMFAKAKPGQKVYIEGIKARGPDGTVRNLGALSFKVL